MRPDARLLLEAALAGLVGLVVSMGLYGYSDADNVQHQQFRPWLEARVEPGLYARDEYVKTLERIPGAFWPVSAAAIRAGVPAEAWFFGAYAASTAALFAVLYAFGWALGGPRVGALGSGLCLLSGHLHSFALLSHDRVMRDRVDQTYAAVPLLIGALALWTTGRRRWALALLGLTFHLNPFFAASLAGVMLVAELMAPSPAIPKRGRETAIDGLVFAALSAPTWIMVLRLPAPIIPTREWAELLRLVFPYHYFPTSWSWQQWLYIAFHGGTLAALYAAAFRGKRPELARLGAAVLAAWAAYSLAAELAFSRMLTLFQTLRLDSLFTMLALLGAALVTSDLLKKGARGWAWAALLWTGLACPHRTLFPLAFLLPPALAWALEPERAAEDDWTTFYAAAVGVLSALRLSAGTALSSLYPVESAAVVALLSALLVFKKPRGWVAAAWGLSAVLGLAELGYARRLERRAIERNTFGRRAAEAFLRTTDRDALVAVVPYYGDMRLGSRRSFVVQLLDGLAVHWDPDFAPGWKKRMEDHGYLFEKAASFENLSYLERFPLLERSPLRLPLVEPWDEAREKLVLERYKPDYIVSPLPLPLGQLVFARDDAGVYDVRALKK